MLLELLLFVKLFMQNYTTKKYYDEFGEPYPCGEIADDWTQRMRGS